MATEVLVPPLGTNVDAVTLVTWHRSEGDQVTQGEPLFAVETDKAVLDVEAPASGVLRGMAAAEGDEVPALSRIAWLCEAGEEPPAAGPVAARAAAGAVDLASVRQADLGREALGRRFASPWARTLASQRGMDWTQLRGTGPMDAVVARDITDAAETTEQRPPRITPLAARAAREAGVDARKVEGTGPAGRITRDDVLRAAAGRRRSVSADPTIAETIPLTGIRGRIADRMFRGAVETASVTLTAEVDATGLVETRTRMLGDGLKAGYNDLLILIVAAALRDHPRLNATYEGDRVVVRRNVNVALAVDTDRGLLAPVIRSVQDMSLAEIADATSAAIHRARTGEIGPDELRGSTFTITNLGMFGIDAFTPILNVPECAILGVGRIKPTPWVVGDCIGIRQAMWLSLTFDHRLVDGGPAARFLQAICRAVEAGL